MEMGVILQQKVHLKSDVMMLAKQATNVPGLGISNEIICNIAAQRPVKCSRSKLKFWENPYACTATRYQQEM